VGKFRTTSKADNPKSAPNNVLQVTFDPLPIFATAKTGVASNAPEHRRYSHQEKPKEKS
jgi:hypothetical protein